MISEYDIDSIYESIIDSKRRLGKSDRAIILWLNEQPLEPGLRDYLIKKVKESA